MYIQYIKRGKKFKLTRKKKLMLVCIILVLIAIGVLLYFNYLVNPIILAMSESKVKSLTQKSVSAAIYEVINHGPVYDDLIKISHDDEGRINMISADSLQINKFTRELVRLSQINLEKAGENGIEIPIGSFSGMPILVGRGRSIQVKLLPIGVITCNFHSEFTQSGVNQTNHRIYVKVNTNVSVIMPTKNQKIATTTELLLAESIIVGVVPEAYLNSTSLDEMLNFIPG